MDSPVKRSWTKHRSRTLFLYVTTTKSFYFCPFDCKKCIYDVVILISYLLYCSLYAIGVILYKNKDRVSRKNGSPRLAHRIDLFTEKLNHYFTLKAFASLLTGIWITLVLYMFDVPYPLLWGIGGFMLNFIPVIGSIIAAIPPVLIAFATHGYTDALWIAGWFLVINVVIGNILEPKIMGKGLEISELIVFLSLVF